jgi:hypothetical protein
MLQFRSMEEFHEGDAFAVLGENVGLLTLLLRTLRIFKGACGWPIDGERMNPKLCLGIMADEKRGFRIPTPSLLEDIKDMKTSSISVAWADPCPISLTE